MRLSAADRDLIKQRVHNHVGPSATIRLFGSRLDESRRGGDIDIFVDLAEPVDDRLRLECELSALLERALDGRSVDVVVAAPNLAARTIDCVARQTGVAL